MGIPPRHPRPSTPTITTNTVLYMFVCEMNDHARSSIGKHYLEHLQLFSSTLNEDEFTSITFVLVQLTGSKIIGREWSKKDVCNYLEQEKHTTLLTGTDNSNADGIYHWKSAFDHLKDSHKIHVYCWSLYAHYTFPEDVTFSGMKDISPTPSEYVDGTNMSDCLHLGPLLSTCRDHPCPHHAYCYTFPYTIPKTTIYFAYCICSSLLDMDDDNSNHSSPSHKRRKIEDDDHNQCYCYRRSFESYFKSIFMDCKKMVVAVM